ILADRLAALFGLIQASTRTSFPALTSARRSSQRSLASLTLISLPFSPSFAFSPRLMSRHSPPTLTLAYQSYRDGSPGRGFGYLPVRAMLSSYSGMGTARRSSAPATGSRP